MKTLAKTNVDFGPYRLSISKELKEEQVQEYINLGLLQEAQRKPASVAEKKFWTEVDPKDAKKFVRGNFKRTDIPQTPEAMESIKQDFISAGYEVSIELKPESGETFTKRAEVLYTEAEKQGTLLKVIKNLGLGENAEKEKVLIAISAHLREVERKARENAAKGLFA